MHAITLFLALFFLLGSLVIICKKLQTGSYANLPYNLPTKTTVRTVSTNPRPFLFPPDSAARARMLEDHQNSNADDH